jgi:hypothetical protein
MTDFTPPMISRTYDPVAKPFVSLGEDEPIVFAWRSASSPEENAMARN